MKSIDQTLGERYAETYTHKELFARYMEQTADDGGYKALYSEAPAIIEALTIHGLNEGSHDVRQEILGFYATTLVDQIKADSAGALRYLNAFLNKSSGSYRETLDSPLRQEAMICRHRTEVFGYLFRSVQLLSGKMDAGELASLRNNGATRLLQHWASVDRYNQSKVVLGRLDIAFHNTYTDAACALATIARKFKSTDNDFYRQSVLALVQTYDDKICGVDTYELMVDIAKEELSVGDQYAFNQSYETGWQANFQQIVDGLRAKFSPKQCQSNVYHSEAAGTLFSTAQKEQVMAEEAAHQPQL